MPKVVVTGGSRGLGLAIGAGLVAAGFDVIAVARNAPNGCAGDLSGLHFMSCDLSDLTALPVLARRIREEHGPIFGLVNNAGLGTPGVLATMASAEIERLILMNVTSPLVLTKHLVRPMLAAGRGRIINVASIVASTGYSGLSAYSATKAALIGFTRSLARELGPRGITVNAVAPGFVDTEMTHDMSEQDRSRIARRSALRRMVRPQDVAATIRFLLSEDAGNITGTTLTVDAGNTA